MADNNITSKIRILETAEQLFADKGFDGVSVRDIAEQAQVNVAMINYYFGNKDDLYLGIVERTLGEFGAELEHVLAIEADPRQRMELFIDCYIEFLYRKAASAPLIARAVMQDDAHIDLFASKYFGQYIPKIEQIIAEGIEGGYFAPLEPKLTVISLLGLIVYFFAGTPILNRVPGMEDYQQRYKQQLAQHTRDLFLNGINHR